MAGDRDKDWQTAAVAAELAFRNQLAGECEHVAQELDSLARKLDRMPAAQHARQCRRLSVILTEYAATVGPSDG